MPRAHDLSILKSLIRRLKTVIDFSQEPTHGTQDR